MILEWDRISGEVEAATTEEGAKKSVFDDFSLSLLVFFCGYVEDGALHNKMCMYIQSGRSASLSSAFVVFT